MSDILRQVDEDLRKEKLSNLWSRYGLYLVSAVIIIILAVVGYQLKNYSDKKYNEELVEEYLNAANAQNIHDKLSLYENLLGSKNEYLSGMAELRIASLELEKGNLEQSLFILEKIINNKDYEPIIRDLATYLLLISNINELGKDEFMNHLDEEKVQESNFRFLFKELISIKNLLLGNKEESKKGFKELIEIFDTPTEIKIRANKFIEIIK